MFDPPKTNKGHGASNKGNSKGPKSKVGTNDASTKGTKKKNTKGGSKQNSEDHDPSEPGTGTKGASKLAKARNHAEQQVLAAWLNFAKGAVDWNNPGDLIQTDSGPMTFEALIHIVEDILNDEDATKAELDYARDLAESVNKMDKDNPDCDTHTGTGGGSTKGDSTGGSKDTSGGGSKDSSKDNSKGGKKGKK